MSQERLAMRKIKEVLRLKWEAGLSNRAIARVCKISCSTVSETLQRAREAGLVWPLPEEQGKKKFISSYIQKEPWPPPPGGCQNEARCAGRWANGG